MLYHWHELCRASLEPLLLATGPLRPLLASPFHPLGLSGLGRSAAAGLDLIDACVRPRQPELDITSTSIDGRTVAVRSSVVWSRPFCKVIHFAKQDPQSEKRHEPRLLVVAPLSGQQAALLKGTIEALLPGHDLYLAEWQDARSVPLEAGDFDLADYIDHLRDMLEVLGPKVHVLAVCQAAVPLLAATALMEADGDLHVPHSLVLMAGPVDARINPTRVEAFASDRGTDWFRRNVISTVPWPHPGAGRRVYPGFLQLTAFLSMSLEHGLRAQRQLLDHLVGGADAAEGNGARSAFYREHLAVMDLTAAFYLQTIDAVFVRHLLPRGQMCHRGRAIDLAAIRSVALMTVEGASDDITGRGQCAAAHALCTGVPAASRQHYECPGAGHFAVFQGARFRDRIAPRIVAFVRRSDPQHRAQ